MLLLNESPSNTNPHRKWEITGRALVLEIGLCSRGAIFVNGSRNREHLKRKISAISHVFFFFKVLNKVFSLQSFWSTSEKAELEIASRDKQSKELIVVWRLRQS